MGVILKAEHISKQYRLGVVGTGTLSNDFNRFWHRIRGKEDPYLKIGSVNDRSEKATEDYVWALRDIDFEVQEGEVLGIIGKNGAGKSTLLKILSRVTSPTTGSIKTRGRIASLLEVGTGFHPELTGRENIYLNGAILGMSKAEIKGKEEEIIAFSGCEMYIDTPVKRYSSGMRVRLAFAVAAHLEPDILVVDEVLAVGDAEFQKKAIGKMQEISSKDGRTVLFVSHNMASIQNLCTKVLLMNNGGIEMMGETEEVINHYLKIFRNEEASVELSDRKDRKGNSKVVFDEFWFENLDGEKIAAIQSGMNIYLVLKISNTSTQRFNEIRISIGIDDDKGRRITILSNHLTNQKISIDQKSEKLIKISISEIALQAGTYYLTLFLGKEKDVFDWVENAGYFEIENGDFFKTGKVIENNQGVILMRHEYC
ncbi:MAG TPA: ABC transporter ATP-binding protein [Flavobacteriaceae bacterium]|nr:ABC transporter ATP-binding protein [Flavobacteriaceae bacterium]HPF12455.1 ABC transporter ATP-binding protein [Flavobacteriaceae bacterium]HQU22633.1 ABC transporter ATP-binding protein [Flavobacteriaceae bacterium]HQU66213.1 ABC transporter ATP-binding protein [Flavobacteriaceae bacterium]